MKLFYQVYLGFKRFLSKDSKFPSVHPCVHTSVHQHLHQSLPFSRSLVFSASVMAASVKPCIEIVLDIPFKHAPFFDSVPLTYISWSIDFVNFYVTVTSKTGFLCIRDSLKCETLHSNCP